MRIPRVFTTQTLTPNQRVELEEKPSRHLAQALRMQEGRELIVFNGDGSEYRGVIDAIGKKQARILITEQSWVDRESPLTVELVIGISRSDRMDWIIQKATELGVARITPVFTENTEVKLKGERLEKKHEHWQQVMISACEQCQRNRLPRLAKPEPLDTRLSGINGDYRFVLHHRTEPGLLTSLSQQAAPARVALLIGPEGGLSQAEIDTATALGFLPLALGPRVLRTETAPLAAISILQYLWGDYNQ